MRNAPSVAALPAPAPHVPAPRALAPPAPLPPSPLFSIFILSSYPTAQMASPPSMRSRGPGKGILPLAGHVFELRSRIDRGLFTFVHYSGLPVVQIKGTPQPPS